MDEPDLYPIAVSVNGLERSLAVTADETGWVGGSLD